MSVTVAEILEGIDYELIAGNIDATVLAVDDNSRNVTEGTMFVAVKGNTNDAHKFIADAVSKKAAAVLVNKNRDLFPNEELIELSKANNTVFVAVDNTRQSLGPVMGNFLNHPEKKLHMIGLTGTKGKTTSTFMLYEIMRAAKLKSGLIGTVQSIVDGVKEDVSYTTPQTIDLYKLIKRMADAGSDNCIMEVSSLGVKFDRVGGIDYRIGCFTNFYEDHISPEEHPTIEDYLDSKLQMFNRVETALVNKDSNESSKVIEYTKKVCKEVITFAVNGDADVVATDITKVTVDGRIGTKFNLKSPWYSGEVFVALPGVFSVYNALCAIAVSGVLGLDFEFVKYGLETVKVPGRVEAVPNKMGITVLVDYAHTGDSLQSVLEALREYTDGRLISVFGCGGGRSAVRRIGMGEASGKYADYTVITTDNPRNEEPMDIIKDILTGIDPTGGKYEIEVDRTNGIRAGIMAAKPGDLVLIAGKGHETYQIVKGVKSHYDDREVAAKILREMEA